MNTPQLEMQPIASSVLKPHYSKPGMHMWLHFTSVNTNESIGSIKNHRANTPSVREVGKRNVFYCQIQTLEA